MKKIDLKFDKKNIDHVYWNPYFGGLVLGLLIIFTFYVTGRGLGASGAMKSTVVQVVDAIASGHSDNNAYYSKFTANGQAPMNTWLVFEVLGILAGAFVSGALTGRIGWKTEHSPKITSKKRLILALSGGVFFGFGAQLARGCTSGAALSGIAVLSTGGLLTMMAIFGSGYVFAYFFRKNWI